MCTESGQNGSKSDHIGKKSASVQNRALENLILDSMFYQKVQLWPSLRMCNSKLGKKAETKTWCICGKFTSNRE